MRKGFTLVEMIILTALTALLESLNIAALKFCTDEMINNLEKGEKLLSDFEVFCPRKGIDISQIQQLKNNKAAKR